MSKTVTRGAISAILSNPSPDSPDAVPELIVQVVDLRPIGNSASRFTFMANDGKMKMKAMLPTHLASEINSGKLQNLGLVRVLDYTCNSIPNQTEKALIVTKCEVISSALDNEIKDEAKSDGLGIMLKPKQEFVAKSAAQIVSEQRVNAAPTARMAMTRRVHPLVSLNPYQGNWTIKVRVTSKGNMRSYKNPRGEGHVFNVELTDEDGTQIQATMFNDAARKFYPKFELGKVYYISRGSLKVANKMFKTVRNDYEMTLNESSEVEEAPSEATFIPEMKFDFVKIDELGSYVNGRELVDIIGVVQSVSPTLSVRRKSNNETVPKRDVTIADDSKKTVVVSLWNDLATDVGQQLLDMADDSPIVAVKGLKVGDFLGVSLSSISRSSVLVNPDLPEAKKLRSWYESEGKETALTSVGSGLVSSTAKNSAASMYADRVTLSHITGDANLGQEKPVYFSVKAYVSLIKPDQALWYRACKTCNKKVTEAVDSGYWCEGCQKNDAECSLRYIMVVKASDPTGEAWLSVFNEQAEQIIGCSADELDRKRTEEGEEGLQAMLKEATWVPHLFRVSVAVHEYNGERRQRITVRGRSAVDGPTESRFLLEEISTLKR
ncbi:RPA70-kDa subunit B [Wolffia australiana]